MKAKVKNIPMHKRCEDPWFTDGMAELIDQVIDVVENTNHKGWYEGVGENWLPDWLEFIEEMICHDGTTRPTQDIVTDADGNQYARTGENRTFTVGEFIWG